MHPDPRQVSDRPACVLAVLLALAFGTVRLRRALRLAKARRHFRMTVPQSLSSPSSGYVRLEGQALRDHRPDGAPVTGQVAAWRQTRFFRNIEVGRFDGDRPLVLSSGGRGLRVTLDQDCVEILRDRRKKKAARIEVQRRHLESGDEEDWEIPEGDRITLWGWAQADGDQGVRLGPGPDGHTVLVLDGAQGPAERLLNRACWLAAAELSLLFGLAVGGLVLAYLTQ
jgi:hypothetical protein